MAQDSSFDIVSRVEMVEVVNAINQAKKELETRFDFRGSKSSLQLDEKKAEITLIGDDEMKLRNLVDILEGKMVKRNVSLRALEYGKLEDASGGTVRQVVKLKQGIVQEKAKAITAALRDSKLKVRAEIRGEEIRVVGAKKDDLQAVIALLKGKDFGTDLQFINYR